MTAVQARIHNAMKQEFKLLKVIIADYCPEDYEYDPVDGSRRARRSDYDMVDVIPVSDPNAATMAQKIVTYQAVLQLAASAPQLYNLPLLHRQMIEVLGVKNANKLVPIEDDATPIDPIQENQNLLISKPVKAFLEQNHQAHIQVHMSAIQNPRIQQMMQANPQAQAIMAAAMAHVNEHIAFQYRIEVEQQMGMPLPPMEKEDGDEKQKQQIPPQMADQIAMAAAQASQQLLQRDQAQAQQQQAQQQMQDPVVQMQMQELQLRMKDLELKAQKQKIDAVAKADQLEIEKSRIEAQKEIAAMQVAANAAAQRDKAQRQSEAEGMRLGIDAAKHKAQLRQQSIQQRLQRQHQSQQTRDKTPPKKETT